MDLECQACSECPKYPVRLPCCQRLHCRRCAWKGLVDNAKYCWYPSCAARPKLSYNLPVISCLTPNVLRELNPVKVTPNDLDEPKSIAVPQQNSVLPNVETTNTEDLKSQKIKKLICSICAKVSSSISSYRGHILSHFQQDFLSVLPKCSASHYQCPQCGATHKTWHSLARHYAFKENKFFTVTERRPEDFPLLVRKRQTSVVTSSVSKKSSVENSRPKNPVIGKSKVRHVSKANRKKNNGGIKNNRKNGSQLSKLGKRPNSKKFKVKEVRVNVLEKIEVIKRKQQEIRSRAFNNGILEIVSDKASESAEASASISSALRDEPLDCQSPELDGDHTVPACLETESSEDSPRTISNQEETDSPTPATKEEKTESQNCHEVKDELSARCNAGLETPGIGKREEDGTILKSEKCESSEYFERDDSPPKKEEPDTITTEKPERECFEEDNDDLQTDPVEEILIPQCPMCICDQKLDLCQQCQSFQITVLATSDHFLLAELPRQHQTQVGLTQGNLVKFLENPLLDASSRAPYPQISEVFNDNMILLSVGNSATATTNLRKGTIAGLCQTWLSFKINDVETVEFCCEEVRIEDDGSLLLSCSAQLKSKLLLLEVENLTPNLNLKNKFTFCDLGGRFKIQCSKATIEYLPTPGEILGSVTTNVDESSRVEIKNSLLETEKNKKDSSWKRPSVSQKNKPPRIKFDLKRTKKTRPNVATMFQNVSDHESDEDSIDNSKTPAAEPHKTPEPISRSSRNVSDQKSSPKVGDGKEPSLIPTVIGRRVSSPSASSSVGDRLSLPTPVPAFRSCGECVLPSVSAIPSPLRTCPVCPVLHLKLKEDTVLRPEYPKGVALLIVEKTELERAGYDAFIKVFTNQEGVLIFPERLDRRYYNQVVPRRYTSQAIVNLENLTSDTIKLRKGQIVGKGCQLLFIKKNDA